ncbi:glycosyltransferase [Enterocloster aldenensis]|uniref:glycosyltransferase n=1 Tax=Enterocloster aldenensis TaxID=358742 RepID=UPI0040284FB4
MVHRKILIISTVGLIYDGITSVIISYLYTLDRTNLDIYIASTIKCEKSIREKIENLDCHVIDFPSRRAETFKYFISLITFIIRNDIDVIHAHGNSGTLAIEMMAGSLGGCKKRIAHSHNTKCNQIKMDKFLRYIFNISYTDALACSEAAGKWLFGKRKFTILENGRNIATYLYNPDSRSEIRKRYKIGNNIAIGHVGGFVPQKNHKFILKVFQSILKQEASAKLFLIGDGELKPDIIKETKELGIEDNICFTGNIDYVPEFLSAMDGMILPSHFEGLPLVAVEWQINGVPFVMSDTVTDETIFTDNLVKIPLTSVPDIWAKNLLTLIANCDRQQMSIIGAREAVNAGFDLERSAIVLKDLYWS